MSLQLSRSWCPDWLPGTRAGSEGVEPPAVGVGDRGATTGSSSRECAYDVVRVMGEALKNRRKSSELPAHDGPAGIGKLPSSRLILMVEVRAGFARKRAEARQGSALERSFDDTDACHRTSDSAAIARPCQAISCGDVLTGRSIAGCSRVAARMAAIEL